VDAGRAQVVDRGLELARNVRAVLESLREVRALLGSMGAPTFASVRDSVAQQLAGILAPGWIRGTPDPWWGQLPKYVRAMVRRLERARGDVERDRRLQAQVEPYSIELRRLAAAADPDTPALARERLRWMLEEFRLSLFAQELRTLQPVSARRLDDQLELARREARGLIVTSPTTSRTA
jgi:ATP-dependent helicase HrpA